MISNHSVMAGPGVDVAHRKFSTIPFLTLYNGAMNVRDQGMSVGDHSMSPGNGCMCIDHEFRLGVQIYNNGCVEKMGRTLKT